MPEISRFLGIIISMYYNDHAPAHFHVRYGAYKATINIDKLSILAGNLPPRVLGLVMEWGMMHRKELKKNWLLAENNDKLNKVEGLE